MGATTSQRRTEYPLPTESRPHRGRMPTDRFCWSRSISGMAGFGHQGMIALRLEWGGKPALDLLACRHGLLGHPRPAVRRTRCVRCLRRSGGRFTFETAPDLAFCGFGAFDRATIRRVASLDSVRDLGHDFVRPRLLGSNWHGDRGGRCKIDHLCDPLRSVPLIVRNRFGSRHGEPVATLGPLPLTSRPFDRRFASTQTRRPFSSRRRAVLLWSADSPVSGPSLQNQALAQPQAQYTLRHRNDPLR